MTGGLKPKKLLYRDGTGQAQRRMEALSPAYARIDERSMEDLIVSAQAHAKELNFFNEQNNIAGNWEAFLADPALSSDNKKWVADILAYLDSPERFTGNSEKFRNLSRPHLALFLSFLQLLGYIRQQLNGFTKRHLDFYYREVLGLSPKKPVPDMVNVIIELANDINGLFIERGTLLLAGKDSLDKDLVYKTDKDTFISSAQIQIIKTLFAEKKVLTIKSAREEAAAATGDKDDGFAKMMQFALGDPLPGDPLPDNIPDLSTASADYVQNKLFLSQDDFRFLLGLRLNSSNERASNANWEKAYDILDKAYKDKIVWGRRQELKQIKEKESDPDNGFMIMLQFALGDPHPLDPLPFYKGRPVNLDVLRTIITADLPAGGTKAEALNYITGELQLSEADFKLIIKTYEDSKVTTPDWTKVYAALEKAGRKKRNYSLPVPFKEEWLNIYTIDDAKKSAFSQEGGKEESSLRFNTFGKGHSAEELIYARPATVGFAVSSSQLAMAEGTRTITLTLSFQKNEAVTFDQIRNALVDKPQPFLFFLSSQKGWTQPQAAMSPVYGDFVVNDSGEDYTVSINNNIITKTAGPDFSADDAGKFIVSKDGTIYIIDPPFQSTTQVKVRPAGKTSSPQAVKKYNAADIYLNAIQFKLTLAETDGPVQAPGAANEFISIQSASPVLAMLLNQLPAGNSESEKKNYVGMYQLFKDLRLEKIKVKTEVTDIKTLTLQNDDSVLNYKKPFEPFGYQPQPGSSLYFAHPELCGKQLDLLTLNLEWMNPPVNFKDYYENYWKIKSTEIKSEKIFYEINNTYSNNTPNTSFKAKLALIDNGARIFLGEINLFKKDIDLLSNPIQAAKDAQKTNPVLISDVAGLIAKSVPAYYYGRMGPLPPDEEEVVDWKRYFRLELGTPDFQHDSYPNLLTKQAFLDPTVPASTTDTTPIPNPLRKLPLNPPYTPKLKSLTAAYTASFEVDLSKGITVGDDRIFHMNAFGYKNLEVKKDTYFLPYFNHSGELYIGLTGLDAPQNLSLLFQMAAGSADPDLEPEPIIWSYLANDEWQALKETSIAADTTNGLLNTGILELVIPGDITGSNTLMPGGMYWLRATVRGNTDAVPDTVDIFTQGLSATFVDNGNAGDHLLTLLPPGSIQETVDTIPEIKKIVQPYTSSKGRPAEADQPFYNRVSERLRHKNRALTMWDYERIVLEAFPQIYKAKCIPAPSGAIGGVDLIVIPDIKGRIPFNPFQPKAPADIIYYIQKYVERRAPAYAVVKVSNPTYVQVKVRTTIKIKEGYSESFFIRTLEDELKRYLAPWAYEEGADIILGGKLYPDMIVNFIAERYYVDYVAGIRLFQSGDDVGFNEADIVRAQRPDVILVSAMEHVIDIIRESKFEEKDFTGIGYMKIELDFKVG